MPINDDDKTEDKDKTGDESLAKIEETLATLNKTMEGIVTGFQQFGEKLERLTTVEKSDDKPPDDEGEVEYDDLETLGRKDFMAVILKGVEKMIKKELEPLSETITGVQQSSEKLTAQQMIKEAEAKYKDFWEWKDEMRGLVERNPYLTAEEAYLLARSQHPDKVKEVDEKYKGPDEGKKGEGEEGEESSSKVIPFGGLTPTSGKTAPKKEMTTKEAAEEAWKKVFGTATEIRTEAASD
jgi:hypothetical protein